MLKIYRKSVTTSEILPGIFIIVVEVQIIHEGKTRRFIRTNPPFSNGGIQNPETTRKHWDQIMQDQIDNGWLDFDLLSDIYGDWREVPAL